MKSLVRPELPTAALRSSQATHAAVDNSAPSATRPESTYKSGKVVQTSGATSGSGAEMRIIAFIICAQSDGLCPSADGTLRCRWLERIAA